jgi:hypothetical protein
MHEIQDPGRLAGTLELDLARFRQARTLVRMPSSIEDLADALGRVAAMLREAQDRRQTVELGEDVLRLIQEFRGALRAVGGAPAEA